jgi:Phosphatidylglycerophosphate synthase
MVWTIPNILTFLRLMAAPGVAIAFLYFTRPYADWFALVLFVTAAATDWFDGYLARAWGQTTKLGAMLDPIADKAMVVIALMVFMCYSSYSAWLVLPATVIVFREVFVSCLREFLGDTAGHAQG